MSIHRLLSINPTIHKTPRLLRAFVEDGALVPLLKREVSASLLAIGNNPWFPLGLGI